MPKRKGAILKTMVRVDLNNNKTFGWRVGSVER